MSDKKRIKYQTKVVKFGGKDLTLYSIDGVTWSSKKNELLEIQDRHEKQRAALQGLKPDAEEETPVKAPDEEEEKIEEPEADDDEIEIEVDDDAIDIEYEDDDEESPKAKKGKPAAKEKVPAKGKVKPAPKPKPSKPAPAKGGSKKPAKTPSKKKK